MDRGIQPERFNLITDGCTWFPDLWIRHCCIAHDYAYQLGVPDVIADDEFFGCIVEASEFLGVFSYLFAIIIIVGLTLGRPFYRWIKERHDR